MVQNVLETTKRIDSGPFWIMTRKSALEIVTVFLVVVVENIENTALFLLLKGLESTLINGKRADCILNFKYCDRFD